VGATTSEDALNEELSTGRIGLAVLFAGSGMKVKILNYCASGLPVITTSVGAEGYENIKSLIVVPPTPTSVAEAIVFLLKSPKISERIGKQNRELILKEFSWTKIIKKMMKVYDSLYHSKHTSNKIISIPDLKPFWFEEKRHTEEIIDGSYKISNKIYELDE